MAHDASVSKINYHHQDGLITISKDCQVRVWSYSLDLWGIIDCRHYETDYLWYFPTRDRNKGVFDEVSQMQIMADELRQDDEQAVIIEHDTKGESETDGLDKYTSKALFDKFKTKVTTEKREKRKKQIAEEESIIEERREFNRAMEISKGKKPVPKIEVEPWDKNKRAIERIEELLEAEK